MKISSEFRSGLGIADARQKKPWLLYIALACSLAVNIVMLLKRGPAGEPNGAPAAASPVTAETPGHADALGGTQVRGAEATSDAAQDGKGQGVGHAEAGAGSAAEWAVVRGKVEQSLARTFQIEGGEAGDALASVYTRLFVWDLDLRRDVQAGDAVAVIWRKGADGVPEIAAASLQSSKLGRTVTAYRWQSPGDPFPSYWHLDGTEAPLRLKDGPIAQYEQITSLLKDRPTHKGMDFKTPVGTVVSAPRAGTVTRTNWNWNANGNCIEIRYDDGMLAKFLHLSENRVTEGQRVSVGQVIALTGNTGHSTAPHLHYQLDRDEKTVDPLDYHGTVRRSLNAEQMASLRSDVAAFEKILGGPSGQ